MQKSGTKSKIEQNTRLCPVFDKDEKENDKSTDTGVCPPVERRVVSHRNKQGTCTASSKEQQEFSLLFIFRGHP